jgi:hypothetical protein
VFAQDAALGTVHPASHIHTSTRKNRSHCLRALRQCHPRRLKYCGAQWTPQKVLRAHELSSLEARYGQGESQTSAAHFARRKTGLLKLQQRVGRFRGYHLSQSLDTSRPGILFLSIRHPKAYEWGGPQPRTMPCVVADLCSQLISERNATRKPNTKTNTRVQG